jgi:hypothetical protein
MSHSIFHRKSKLKIEGVVDTYLWDASIVPDYRTSLILLNNKKYYSALIQKAAVKHERTPNLVVNAGLALIIGLLINTTSDRITHCGVGSGTNSPAAGDTALQTQIARIAITDRYPVSNNELHADTFFSTVDANGSWNETGLFTASSGGTMLCRKKFISTFNKTTGNTATVAWTITLTAVP